MIVFGGVRALPFANFVFFLGFIVFVLLFFNLLASKACRFFILELTQGHILGRSAFLLLFTVLV